MCTSTSCDDGELATAAQTVHLGKRSTIKQMGLPTAVQADILEVGCNGYTRSHKMKLAPTLMWQTAQGESLSTSIPKPDVWEICLLPIHSQVLALHTLLPCFSLLMQTSPG